MTDSEKQYENNDRKASIEKKVSALRPYQWKPGQSGNPKGRPKRKTLSEAVYEVLMEEFPNTGKTNLEMLARVIVKEAMKGKFPFAKEILDRLEGKVELGLTLNGAALAGNGDVNINILNLTDDELRGYQALLAKLDRGVEPRAIEG